MSEQEFTSSDDHFNYEVTVTGDQDMSHYSRDEVERRAKHWFDTALQMKHIQDELAHDLELALNACKSYQFWFATMMQANDPNLEVVRKLFIKYKMGSPEPSQAPGKVYADGQDITETPDAIDGEAVDFQEWDDIPDNLTIELVQNTETGEFGWIIKDTEPEDIPDAEVLDDEPEPTEEVDPASRDWLSEPNEHAPDPDAQRAELQETSKAFQEEVAKRLNEYVETLPPEVQRMIPTIEELEKFFTDVADWENDGGSVKANDDD